MLDKAALARLRLLLSQPTAPFREQAVAACIAELCRELRLPLCRDEVGNLILGARSLSHYRQRLAGRSARPLPIFIAHMDHPGFHGARWLEPQRLLQVDWLGGTRAQGLKGARVWLADRIQTLGQGRITHVEKSERGFCTRARIRIYTPSPGKLNARDLHGGLDFERPYWRRGKRIYARAADDLAGVFAILEMAVRWRSLHPRAGLPFFGLFTRGEEVGFTGALAHFEQGWLQRATRAVCCVSVETSRTLPGALIGKGPVVRLGDRLSLFDSAPTRVVLAAAQQATDGRFQSRVMDGGACEASAASAFELPTVGLSLALGNYHNFNLDGWDGHAARPGPAPEWIHLDDLEGLIATGLGLVSTKDWHAPTRALRQSLLRRARRYRRQLNQSNS